MYIHIHMHTHIYIYIYIYIHTHIYIYIYIQIYICIYLHVSPWVSHSLVHDFSVCLSVCVCVCVEEVAMQEGRRGGGESLMAGGEECLKRGRHTQKLRVRNVERGSTQIMYVGGCMFVCMYVGVFVCMVCDTHTLCCEIDMWERQTLCCGIHMCDTHVRYTDTLLCTKYVISQSMWYTDIPLHSHCVTHTWSCTHVS